MDHVRGFVDLSLAAFCGAKARCVHRDFRPSSLRFGVSGGKMNDLLKPALFHIDMGLRTISVFRVVSRALPHSLF